MDKYYTTSTLEDIENYCRNNKKLRRKLTIIETSCSTLFHKPKTLFGKVGYSFAVVNRGDVREIQIFGLMARGASARRSSAMTKCLFEMIFGIENTKKLQGK